MVLYVVLFVGTTGVLFGAVGKGDLKWESPL